MTAMNRRIFAHRSSGRSRAVALVAAALAGCGTTIFSLRVPLHEDPQALPPKSSRLELLDERPTAARVTRTGRAFACERRYGDETFQPSGVDYLHHLLAARVPPGETRQVRLERFEIVEFCEQTASRAGAAAATGASYGAGAGTVYMASAVPGGDRVEIRVSGKSGDAPFDARRQFDYSDLQWRFTELPAHNAEYRERLRKALGEIADEIAKTIPPRST
jgi:hypothetical protein